MKLAKIFRFLFFFFSYVVVFLAGAVPFDPAARHAVIIYSFDAAGWGIAWFISWLFSKHLRVIRRSEASHEGI